MTPRSDQNVDDKEAAAIGIEVVPSQKTREAMETEDSSSSLETGQLTPHLVKRKVPNTPKMSRREWILAGIGVFALLALGVILGVALAPRNDTETATSRQKENPFPETKSYIDNVCSSLDDSSLCQDVCAPAHCCVTSGRDSCLSERADSCLAYAKCHAVMEDLVAPPAPHDLQEVCSSENLDECKSACQAAKCCFDEYTPSCQATQLLTCLDYAPCQVLNNESKLPPADINELLKKCSLSVDGTTPSEEREQTCRKASCCWDDGDESCLQANFVACLSYSPCKDLVLRKPNSMVDRPTVNVEQVCSVDSVLTLEGFQQCKEACQSAWCCHATREPYNCFMEDPFGCLHYQQCGVLPLAGGSVPRAPSNLTDICKGIDELESGALQSCIDSCKPSACCVADGDDNCYNDGNALACDEYEICKPVHSLYRGKTLRSPPNKLAVCTREIISTEAGFKMCANICEPAACCNSLGSDNCLLDNIAACGEWNIGGCYLLATAATVRGGS